MSTLPQIHRTSDLGHSAEYKHLCGLHGEFMTLELTRVKGSDSQQKRKISWLRSTALTHLAAGNPLSSVERTATAPQGDL